MNRNFFVGGYTDDSHPLGISRWQLDPATGELSCLGSFPTGPNPSYLALSRDQQVLYAVLENGETEGKPGGSVSAFADLGDKASCISIQNTGGGAPCHLSLHPTGKWLYVANYGGGSVAVFAVLKDAALSPCKQLVQHEGQGNHPQRQEAPHAHQVLPLSQETLLVVDLGLDQALVYPILQDGTLGDVKQRMTFPPGTGPRHGVLHSSGQLLYILSELSSEVFAYRYSEGQWQAMEALSTLPVDIQTESTGAAIHMHESGRYLAVSNRGHDSIALFGVDEQGRLRTLGFTPCGGKTPRDFRFLGDYLVCACQDSNLLTVLWLDTRSDRLIDMGKAAEAFRPTCILPIEGGA